MQNFNDVAMEKKEPHCNRNYQYAFISIGDLKFYTALPAHNYYYSIAYMVIILKRYLSLLSLAHTHHRWVSCKVAIKKTTNE